MGGLPSSQRMEAGPWSPQVGLPTRAVTLTGPLAGEPARGPCDPGAVTGKLRTLHGTRQAHLVASGDSKLVLRLPVAMRTQARAVHGRRGATDRTFSGASRLLVREVECRSNGWFHH